MSSSSRIVGRTLARCQALQLLFQAEACGRSVADVLAGDYVLSEGPPVEYGEQLARGTDEHRAELDHVLSGAARNWSISRMSATDRNLLRVALYEILFEDDVDKAVSIDECVELAKAFGSSDESSRFVNGVLGRVAADIDNGVDVIEVARKNYEDSAAELASAALDGLVPGDDVKLTGGKPTLAGVTPPPPMATRMTANTPRRRASRPSTRASTMAITRPLTCPSGPERASKHGF